MSGIDYSKWDKFDCNSSSGSSNTDSSADEADEGHGGSAAPQVTRLEYPTRVTLGPSGVQLASPPPKATASPFLSPAPLRTVQNSSAMVETSEQTEASASESLVKAKPKDEHVREEGGDGNHDDDDDAEAEEDMLYESLARNGGREGGEHWWSQSEDSATVSFLIPWETTAKCVSAFHLREVRDGASDSYRAQLDVTLQLTPHAAKATPQMNEEDVSALPRVVYICKQFRYPIKLAEELVEGCWQLHRMPRRHVRLLVVEVFKEPIGQGMTLWWDRCFVSDTASVIDTQQIPDRVQRGAAAGPGAAAKAEEFRRVWDEAHEEFRRRMKERKAKPT